MQIKKVILDKYKKVEHVEFTLDKVNVLIGGNNAGKSSILQGIHFSVTVGAMHRRQGQDTFSSDLLIYNPALDFTLLRNGSPYKNMGDDKGSALTLIGDVQDQELRYKIEVNKGRNHGNINCSRSGDFPAFGITISDPNSLFSIYVPGLAGIPQSEELKAKALVRRGVASGDANLYLRNVIYYIDKQNQLEELNRHLHIIFPDISLNVVFDEDKDTSLIVTANVSGRTVPLELLGTGTLQIVQILSYITYFNPKILLLDEPDSHLHPNNQVILAEALQDIAERTGTQIILCTHSRHIIDALYGQANFIWVKDGRVQNEGHTIEKLPLLLDIGALDEMDRFRQNNYDVVFLTEDRKTDFLKTLLLANGFDLEKILCLSYKTSSNLEGAALLVDFIKEVNNNCKVVIHRDRDFMTDSEVEKITRRIEDANAIPFITRGSDIESYFVNPEHIANVIAESVESISEWINQLAIENHVKIQQEFTRKRDEIKQKLYTRDNVQHCPDSLSICGQTIPFPEGVRKGKTILKMINGKMHDKFRKEISLRTESSYLQCAQLNRIRNLVCQETALVGH